MRREMYACRDWIAAVDSVLNAKKMTVEDMRSALDGLIDYDAMQLLEMRPDAESRTRSIVPGPAPALFQSGRPAAHSRCRALRPRGQAPPHQCDSKTHHMGERDY